MARRTSPHNNIDHNPRERKEMPLYHHGSLRTVLLAGAILFAIAPAVAAEVTPARLVNPEPGNWLINHRTYDAQRYSPLDRINTSNIKRLRLAYAVAIGGTAANENLEATPLADDGFLYVVDQWGVVYKIDGRSGDVGRIMWRMDPGQEKTPLANRGAALWGNLVVSVASYPARVIATDKETGKVAWETNLADGQPDLQLTAAPLPVKDKILVGAAGGDRGVRDFIAGLDGATGKLLWRKYTVPAPGEPGSETWKDNNNAWQTGGAAMWVTGSYDFATNQVLWGTGNPVPMYNPFYRPGDNLYTNSLISWDPDTGKMNWYHQYVPGDMWDYDAAGTHILIDGDVAGEPHKAGGACGAQRLHLCPRTRQRSDLAGEALHGGNQLDQGHRPENRPADRLRSGQGHPGLFRHAKSDLDRSHQEAVPVARGRQQLLVGVLQPTHPAHLLSIAADLR
jgi:alcohol dehydrogenase (cytochrome c)